eukprot:jgi/Astpho2/7810/fgenesh1_pg.00117_%23_26_t
MLSNRAPQDVDILTSANHSRVKKLFRGAIEVGRNFPIMLVPVDGKRVEVSAFKKASFKDQLPADAGMMAKGGASWATYRRTDALRRDFTVNGLMCDPFSQLVFDYTGGLADCSKRLVRTIGPAETSLRHDPIRMLRAVRFCSTSGWKMAADLKAVITNHPGLLAEAQRGRLHLELRKMLLRGAAHSNVMLLWRLKLLDLLLPTYACWLQALDKAVPQGMEAPAEVVLALLAAPVLAQVMLANHAEIEQALQQRDEQPSDSSSSTQPAERAGASKRKRSSRKAAQAGPGKPGSCETASKPSEGRDVPLADILATGLRLFRELDPQSTAVKLSRGARRDTQHQNGKPAGVLGPLTAEQRMYAALVSATVQALLVPSCEALQEAAAQLGTQGQPQALNPAEPPFPRLEMENAIEIMCREFSRRQNDPPDQLRLQDLSNQLQRDSIKPLKNAMDRAAASLTLPDVVDLSSAPLADILAQQLKQRSVEPVLLGSCPGAAGQALQEPLAVLRQDLQKDGRQHVVLCAAPGSTLQQEMQLLSQASEVLVASGKQHLAVFAVDPAEQAVAAQRRSLLQRVLPTQMSGLNLPGHSGAGSGVGASPVPETWLCNSKCQAQVRVVETIILGICLISALAAGTFMLNMLDTPTKFETPKESRHGHGHE